MTQVLSRDQLGFFDEERLNPLKAMNLTVESLMAYAPYYEHWAMAYSGGKDSTAMVTVILHLLAQGLIPAPKTLDILYADTRLELPPLQISAMKLMQTIEKMQLPCKVRCRVVLPEMDKRYWVYMLGRGVPPPTNGFRWCTPGIKVQPMLTAMSELHQQTGKKILMLTGVRVGESAARDQRIAVSCGKNGAECGQGWFQETTPESIADTLAPLLHWRVCHVWDWLRNDAPINGFSTAAVAEVYGGDRAEEVNARTGCIGCNLASRDVALERVLRLPIWQYLTPLRGLRPLYQTLRRSDHRLRKHGEMLKSGWSETDRLGPLTMEARLWALDQVLGIQNAINSNPNRAHLPMLSLIDAHEEARIRELVAANTWPERWDGTEDRGDVLRPVRFTRGGGRQMQMLLEGAVHA